MLVKLIGYETNGLMYGYANIQNITVESDNENFVVGDEGALYDKAKTTVYLYPAKSTATDIEIPSTVTQVRAGAFLGAMNLKSISFLGTVNTIGDWAFAHASSLNYMEFATGNSVVTKLTGDIEHVKYSQEDLILVAPATANTISKFANRIADNPISTLLITAYGHDTPIIFVPSMHDSMYRAIEENIKKIEQEGSAIFINPRMDEGKAKFPSKEDIVLESLRAINLNKKD